MTVFIPGMQDHQELSGSPERDVYQVNTLVLPDDSKLSRF